jgi:hypothetical protein
VIIFFAVIIGMANLEDFDDVRVSCWAYIASQRWERDDLVKIWIESADGEELVRGPNATTSNTKLSCLISISCGAASRSC